MDEIHRGRWVYDNITITKKAFTCCGWDTKDWRDPEIKEQCGPTDARSTTEFTGRTDYHVQTGGHACTCDEIQHQRHTVSEREKYRWVPDGCELLKWNATYFCELLGDRKMVFLGDSTMGQTATTVMNMLIANEPKGMCGEQLLFFHMNLPEERRYAFDPIYTKMAPEFVIVNFGAHFHNDGIFERDMHIFLNYTEQLKAMIAPKTSHWIWKTINSPHFQCFQYTAPTLEFPIEPNFTDYYQWELFPKYDKLSKVLFPAHGMQIMDMSMLRTRPDGHPGKMSYQWSKIGGDCLHFCQPGPLNIISNMLTHMLLHHTPQKPAPRV